MDLDYENDLLLDEDKDEVDGEADHISTDFMDKFTKDFIEYSVDRISKSREMKSLQRYTDDIESHETEAQQLHQVQRTQRNNSPETLQHQQGQRTRKNSGTEAHHQQGIRTRRNSSSEALQQGRRTRRNSSSDKLVQGKNMVHTLMHNTQSILSRVSSFFPLLRSFSRHSSDSGFVSTPPSRPLSRRSSLFSLGSYCNSEADDSDEEFMSHVKVVPGGNVTDDYTLLELLGEGAFSKVYLAESKLDKGGLAAVKVINKGELCQDEDKMFLVEKEIEIMSQLDHPNIVKLYEVYVNTEEVCLVMELAKGGEVFDKLLEYGSLPEPESAKLMSQVLEAVKYLHSLGIVHRDLKPENILLYDNKAGSKVMVTDFGLSDYEEDLTPESAVCGTATYLAPEVIKRTSSTRAQDMWSLGVICYIILCGYPPFFRDNKGDGDETELLKQIARGKYKFHNNFWDDISVEAKMFVRGLMNVDPYRRMTAEEALQHPWILNNTRNFFHETCLQSFFQTLLILGITLSFFYLYFYVLSYYFNIEYFFVSKMSAAAANGWEVTGHAVDRLVSAISNLLSGEEFGAFNRLFISGGTE